MVHNIIVILDELNCYIDEFTNIKQALFVGERFKEAEHYKSDKNIVMLLMLVGGYFNSILNCFAAFS
jgi:hypothetical protein